MKRNNYKRRAVIHGLSMAVFLGACLGTQADDQDKRVSGEVSVQTDRATPDNKQYQTDRFTTDATNGKLSRAGADFIREAARSGLLEMKMGQTAADHASNADVKSYGEKLVVDHKKAQEKLTQIAGSSGVNLAKDLEGKHAGMIRDMEQKSGAEFDKEFVRHALKHHREDINKFEKASRELQDSELRSWAMSTLPTLREHFAQAQRLARSLGVDVTTADLSGYGASASAAAGSPGVSVESGKGSINRDDSNINQQSTGRADVDLDYDRNDAEVKVEADVDRDDDDLESKVEVDTDKGDGKVLGIEAEPGDNEVLGVETRKGDGKTLGITTVPGDGKTLGLNTRKDDGKLLGIIPAPGGNKAEADVDVDTDDGDFDAEVDVDVDRSDRDVSVGAPPTGERGAQVDTTVNYDKSAATLKYGDLPKAVQETIRKEGGSTDIEKVKRETKNGKMTYQVEFQKDGRNRILHIAEDGTIIKDNKQ